MPTRTFVGSILLALLPLAAFALPSCGSPACDNGGEGCPCEKAIECGELPPCKGWLCDGTCHLYDQRVGFRCATGVCDGVGHCLGCLQDADCGPGHTCEDGNVCSSCGDAVKNGDETDVDCGGSCALCPGTCNVDADCGEGGYCWQGLCARCDDGIQNGNEQGIDCGALGEHCPICLGFYCTDDVQCISGHCSADRSCCKVSCNGCTRCNLDGECVPSVGQLPWAECPAGQSCGYGGVCAWPDGHACTKDEECIHISCVNGICT